MVIYNKTYRSRFSGLNVNFGALDVTIPSDSTSEKNSDIKTIQQIPMKICHKKAGHQQIVNLVDVPCKLTIQNGRVCRVFGA